MVSADPMVDYPFGIAHTQMIVVPALHIAEYMKLSSITRTRDHIFADVSGGIMFPSPKPSLERCKQNNNNTN